MSLPNKFSSSIFQDIGILAGRPTVVSNRLLFGMNHKLAQTMIKHTNKQRIV
eukprot:jgi/Botrbrau1/22205/Bobra.168_1s0036.1